MKKAYRYGIGFLLLILSLLFLMVLNLNSGSADLSARQILDMILANDHGGTEGMILWDLRMPRILAAFLLGGALAVSGFLLQTFFGNPIAGPYVLGISSGAKLLVALVMVAFLRWGRNLTSASLILAAFCGSLICMGFVLLISSRVGSMSILIVCGVMIGYICTAITEFIVTFADDSNIVNLHNWSMGSFSGIYWDNVAVMAMIVIPAFLGAFLLSKPIYAFQLGEVYARNMGINIRLFRAALILLSSLLSACVTAFAGPISFVGIAVPHVMKRLFRSSQPLIIIPACFLGGSVFCLWCDYLARTMFAPTEFSISSITAVFGAPVVITMLLRRK